MKQIIRDWVMVLSAAFEKPLTLRRGMVTNASRSLWPASHPRPATGAPSAQSKRSRFKDDEPDLCGTRRKMGSCHGSISIYRAGFALFSRRSQFRGTQQRDSSATSEKREDEPCAPYRRNGQKPAIAAPPAPGAEGVMATLSARRFT